MKIKDILKRKKYSSPYYGNNKALGTVPAVPLRQEEPQEEAAPKLKEPETDWERLRFELIKTLIAQDRRSVVLGKLKTNNRQIAENARKLADAVIAEMRNHPYRENHGGEKPEDL